MKIKTEKFRRFSNPILASYVQGDQNAENMYLDFSNSCAYFSNNSFIAKLNFDFEIEDPADNDMVNVMVDKKMFLALCTEYEELTVTSQYNSEKEDYDFDFSYDEEKFTIPTFTSEQDFPEFDYNDFESYHLTSSVLRHIRTASNYMGVYDPQENYYGVNVHGDRVVGTDSAQVFEAQIKEDGVDFPDIKLKGEIVKLVLTISEFEVCYLNYNENTDEMFFTFGDNKELYITTTQGNLRVPDVTDDNFIDKYHHETYFIVNKTELIDVLEFFQVFVRNERNERLYINIVDKEVVSIESQSESTGNRNIDLTECSDEIVGDGFWIPRALVVKAVKSIEDDFIKIEIDTNKPAFNIVGKENDEKHIATVRLY